MKEKDINSYMAVLPIGITQRYDGYWNSKELLTNFWIVRIRYYTENHKNSSSIVMVELDLEMSNGKKFTLTVSLETINRLRTTQILPDELMYFISAPRLNKLIKNIVCQTLKDAEPQEMIVPSLGYNIINDNNVIFCLGDTTINKLNKNHIINKSKYKLKIRYNGKDYLGTIAKLIQSNNFPATILIAMLSSFVKPLLETNSQTVFGYTIYIYGKSGTGKTSIAKFYTDIFENSDNIASLSSEKLAIKQLSQFKDIFIFVDDVNQSDSSRIKNANEL